MIDSVVALQLAFGVLVGSSALDKVRDPAGHIEHVIHYGVVPAQVAPAIAVFSIAAELTIAGAWFLNGGPGVALATMLLVAVYSLAILAAIRRGARVACGCGGLLASTTVGIRPLIRNAILSALAALLALLATSGAERAPLTAIGLAPAVCLAVVIVSFFVFADDLISLEWQLRRHRRIGIGAMTS